MKSFDVFQLPNDSYVAVKHGFSWPAFFFNWIWCLGIARLYGWGAVWIGVLFISGAFDRIVSEPTLTSVRLALGIVIINLLFIIGFQVWFAFNANEFRRRKYLQLGYALVRENFDADNPKGAISVARDENRSGKEEKTINAPLPSETPQTMVSPSLVSQSGPVPENKPSVAGDSGGKGEPMTSGIAREQESDARDEVQANVAQSETDGEVVPPINDEPVWPEKFQILYEYDPIVKECQDELENLDSQLAEQFRKEVVSDRKKAPDIRDRLKADYEKKLRPYNSEALNDALSEARLIGPGAEEEFVRVIEVMGDDTDVEPILQRLKEKTHTDSEQDTLDKFLNNAPKSKLLRILALHGFSVRKEGKPSDNNYLIIGNTFSRYLNVDEIPEFIKEKLSPKEILEYDRSDTSSGDTTR